jgi:hypothetical protein
MLTPVDIENATLGISATPLGTTIATQAGFEEKEVLRFSRTASSAANQPCEVELWIGVRPPSHSPSAAATVCSDSPASDLSSL